MCKVCDLADKPVEGSFHKQELSNLSCPINLTSASPGYLAKAQSKTERYNTYYAGEDIVQLATPGKTKTIQNEFSYNVTLQFVEEQKTRQYVIIILLTCRKR